MQRFTTSCPNAPEPTYSHHVFEAILEGVGRDGTEFICRPDGAYPSEVFASTDLAWHRLTETVTKGSPNPQDEPWLPFPFSARQLAALMVDGWGYFIRSKYGDWDEGPDSEALSDLGPLGAKAKEAIAGAHAAYGRAITFAPRLNPRLSATASQLEAVYRVERDLAIEKEGLWERGITDAEYGERLARVNQAVIDLAAQLMEAQRAATAAEAAWRKAVVQHLLMPIEQVPSEAFADLGLRTIAPEHRAEHMHVQRLGRAFETSEAGREHFELVCQKHDVERALREYELRNPVSITELAIRDDKVKELKGELRSISGRMEELERRGSSDAKHSGIAPTDSATTDRASLATRTELVAAFGGFGLRIEWFEDLGSRNWLRAARKVIGRGQRGNVVEPLFCPFEVMNGLVEHSRKSKLTPSSGWRILENRFPVAYAKNQVADPREPPG